MRAMLGLLEPTYGEIEVMGVDVRERPKDVCRIVGFMPDFPPVYEDLMVWEFLDLFAASYGLTRSQRRHAVADHLDMVGLTEKREAMVGELSRGMRQRMMLAKTLIPNPHVLLLDEPASGIDPQGRIDLKNILRRLAEEKKTVLISSHILAEMNEFCTSVVIMEKGQIDRRRPDRRGQPAGHGRLVPRGRGAGRARAVPLDRRRRRTGRRDRVAGQEHLRVPLPRRRPGRQRAAGDPGAAGRAHLRIRPPPGQSRRPVPQGGIEGALVMLGPHPRLDRQPDPRQARPVAAPAAAVLQLAGRRGDALPLHRLCRLCSSTCSQTGAAAGMIAGAPVRAPGRSWAPARSAPRSAVPAASGILDFHRVSPMTPTELTLGFFFGAPIREYPLFAATLPFTVLCMAFGVPSLRGFVQLMIILLTTAWMLPRPGPSSMALISKGKTADRRRWSA